MYLIKILRVCVFFCFTSITLGGQSVSIAEKHTIIDSICVQQMEESNFPGMAIMISQQGEIKFKKGYGYADVDKKTRVIPEKSLFRIGSVSKSLTSAGLAVLVEKNMIDLDAPIQKYVPYFPQKKHTISLRDLTCHVAGIRHYKGLEFMMNREFPDVKSGVELFMNDDLEFEPKTRYKYSSFGWNLVSAAIEGAAKKGFLDYIQQNVFTPLDMQNTYAEKESFNDPNTVAFYNQNDQQQLLYAMPVNNSYKWAGGGFLSTAEDLVKFANGILNNKLFSSQTREEFWTSCELADGSRTNYGLGWIDNVDDVGRKYVGHSGGSVGGTSMLLIYPEEKVVVVVLINQGQANMDNIAKKMATVVLNQ
jgi:CubicO group peptidase (beta-lactamase class C family)